ncbi:MAG: 6-phosphogluconolactonase [Chloroflexi bacterium]|nr:6-phosphogluconolactonase [Chloroflexota bacterium]
MSDFPVRHIVDDAAAAAVATAELVITAAQQAVAERGVFHLCTTGGSTPAALYAALREPGRAARMPWNATQIWFGDDRHVPRTSPLSNLVSLDAVLLAADKLGVASPIRNDQVYPWPTGENGSKAVSDYLATIRAAGIQHTADGFPQFDLVLIGIGGDSHCLSVFPSSPLTSSDAPIAAPVPAPTHIEPHVPRLSFSLGLLLAARAVCATIVGAGKSAALARILNGEGTVSEVPAKAALIPTATWIIDRAAAADL